MKKIKAKQGRPVPGYPCPDCGGLVVYNGNYFCDKWRDGCDWALPHYDPVTQPKLFEKELKEEEKLQKLLRDYEEHVRDLYNSDV